MKQDAAANTVLRAGDTCWRIENASRFAVIIDAADYFSAVRSAVLKARHTVTLVGWDFDTRIKLDPRDGDSPVPNRLGAFVAWVVKNRPDLSVHILKWDLGILQSLTRGSTPLMFLDWITSKRISFKLDHAHPTGGAHHQKIVVIDDALAFCGGIDMTADRWDTRDHSDDNPYRKRPTSQRSYGPWHDATAAVAGDAARALGELVRERWKAATGETLPAPPPRSGTLWPDGLEPLLTDVPVGISRTRPPHGDLPAAFEIEALYLAAIAATRRTLYIESQYFASRRIAEAMARRLSEPDGPEIVVVNPNAADGWLEEEVMGSSRARLLQLIEEADTHRRFRLYTPVTAGGQPIYVHAKVLVMDDSLLRIGSSNLNNRSMGFDTECDVSIEATPGVRNEADIRARILDLRHDLLAEHLGVAPEAAEAAVAAHGGSLISAIEALRTDGRSLRPFEPPELGFIGENIMGENSLLDPERPTRLWRRLGLARGRRLRRGSARVEAGGTVPPRRGFTGDTEKGAANMMDESASRSMIERAPHEESNLPAVAPAVAALTLAAAGLTLFAAYWLLKAKRTDDRRARFPAPAVHRRT